MDSLAGSCNNKDMLTYNTHLVTLKILKSNGQPELDYLKKHSLDLNAWAAYFELSSLEHDKLLRETFILLPKEITVKCAIGFAESVLPLFEAKYPNDNRPRLAIEAARAWIGDPCERTADAARAADAAYAAAYAANAAYYAARAADAAYAAAYAANAAANAADAAYYAARAARAAYAAYATNQKDIEKQQLNMILEVIQKNSI